MMDLAFNMGGLPGSKNLPFGQMYWKLAIFMEFSVFILLQKGVSGNSDTPPLPPPPAIYVFG